MNYNELRSLESSDVLPIAIMQESLNYFETYSKQSIEYFDSDLMDCLSEIFKDDEKIKFADKNTSELLVNILVIFMFIKFVRHSTNQRIDTRFYFLNKLDNASYLNLSQDGTKLNIGVRQNSMSPLEVELTIINPQPFINLYTIDQFLNYFKSSHEKRFFWVDTLMQITDTSSDLISLKDSSEAQSGISYSSMVSSTSEDVTDKIKDMLNRTQERIQLNDSRMNQDSTQSNESDLIQNDTIYFKWCGKENFITYPFFTGEFLDHKNPALLSSLGFSNNEWFINENHFMKTYAIGLWARFIYDSYNPKSTTQLSLNWTDYSEYILKILKEDLVLRSKDINEKILKVRTLIESGAFSMRGAIAKQNFIEDNCIHLSVAEDCNPIDFMKLTLWVQKNSAQELGQNYLINPEYISDESYYSLSEETNELQLWTSIIFRKLFKDQIKNIDYQKIYALKDKFPNFSDVIDYYCGALSIYEKNGTMPSPILMLGDPGLGKTYFCQELSKILNSDDVLLPISSLTAGWILSGSSPQWKDSDMGKVAKSLIYGKNSNPIFILDEIDKKIHSNYDPLGSLYPLLENRTAKKFTDEYFIFPIDASGILWFATANNINSIDDPIQDRFIVFEIKNMTPDQIVCVINNIWSDLTQGLDVEDLSEEIIEELKVKPPRKIRQILKKALAFSALENKNKIKINQEHFENKTIKKKFGFS